MRPDLIVIPVRALPDDRAHIPLPLARVARSLLSLRHVCYEEPVFFRQSVIASVYHERQRFALSFAPVIRKVV